MKKFLWITIWTALVTLNVAEAAEKKLSIKLGTLAPTGTSYHKQLLTLKERWAKASAGSINVIVYPDGRQGNENEMVSAMATGNLQAGLLTAAGLGAIDRSMVTLQSIPLAFRTLEELDYVTEKLQPMLSAKLAEKGFVALFWSDSGWVRFFSKERMIIPDDLRKMKVFSWAGGKNEFEAWKAGGFSPISLEVNEMFSSMGTGIINAAPMPPFFALASQIDTLAPHMLELNWSALIGALVIKKETWDKIPAATQTELLTIAAEIGREVKARGRAENQESIASMQKRKLQVHPVTPEVQAQWEKAVLDLRDRFRGPIVPTDLYDAVMGHLKDFREKKP